MTFSELNINNVLIEKLSKINIVEPTAVQKKIIPLINEDKNLMFQSETGTGKTYAYLLPLISKLLREDANGKEIKILIIAPTYELASQIKIQIQAVSNIKSVLCIGGSPITRQIEMLKEKPRIVIGGAARILELIHLKKIKTNSVETLVLDEADRLLSVELRNETEKLLERLPRSVQLIGNSATVSETTKKILQKAREDVSKNDEDVQGNEPNQKVQKSIEFVSLPMENVLQKRITHWAIYSEKRSKIDTLRSFIHAENPEKLIVFTCKADQVSIIAGKLRYKKIECEGLSRNTEKKERKIIIDRFKSGKIKVLITTDLTSRGIDIPDVSHVVQLDLPESEDFFIHRAGRTARAGKMGINCVIGDEVELRRYAALEKKLKLTVYPKEIRGGKVDAPKME